MNRRFLRQAFDRYLAQVRTMKQQQVNVERTEQYVAKVQSRYKKEIFTFLQAMAKNKIAARKKFKKLMDRHNAQLEKHYYQRWLKFNEGQTKKKLKKKQQMVTEEVQATTEAEGDTEDKVFEMEKKEKQMVSQQRSLGKKTLKKVIARWRDNQYEDVFNTWKKHKAHKEKAQKMLNQTIFMKLDHRLKHNAFTWWRKNMHILEEKAKKHSTQLEVENEQVQEEKLEASRTRIAQVRERSAFNIEKARAK